MIILNQPAGYGDHLFIQTIANDFVKEGEKVIIPYRGENPSIQKHFHNVTFIDLRLLKIDIDIKKEYTLHGARVIPLRYAENIQKLPYKDCMKAKYSLLGKDFTRWREMTWIRHPEHEQRLFSEVLGLQEGEPYNLVNVNFRFDNSGRALFKVENGLKNIEMKILPGYTLLDWGKIIQNATQIHSVSTSLFYLLELMDLKAEQLHLYLRRDSTRQFQEGNFETIEELFTKAYQLHY